MSDDRAPRPQFTANRRRDRASNELVGLCRGLLADGHVDLGEAVFLKDWIERNAQFVGDYPFREIYALLADILQDGRIDADESADLHDTLVRFIGGEAFDEEAQTASLSTALPLDDPEPLITYPSAGFVVTGTFTFGKRTVVTSEIERRGGVLLSTPSKKTRYLIVGELGSRDWINSNAGRKIEKAVELRANGCGLAIVSERHWITSLG